ncbi:MAG: BamA/TamA family outer membrane protein, partial [Planctomycetota bacterium]
LDPGDTFDRRRLDEDTTKMREAYGRLGRLYASVEPVPRFTETPGIVDLVYEIDEDRVYYIRNVNVDIGGEAPHTKTNVVRNTMLLHPGDLANPKLLQRSRSRLEGSPAFSRQAGGGVQIDVQKVDDARVAGALPSVRGQSFVGPEHPAGHRPRRHGDVHVTFMVEPDAAEDPRFPVGPASRRPTASRRNFEPAGPQIRGQNASVYRDGNPFVAEEIPSPFVRQPNPFEQPAAPAFNRQANPFAAVDNAARGTTPQITRPVRVTAGQAAPPITNAALTRPAPTTPAAAPTAAAPTVTAEANTQLVGRNPYTIRQAGATGPFAQANPLFGDQADDPDPLGTFGGDPPGFVDVNVNANEGQTGRFMFGASVNSNAGLLGNIVLEEQNFDLFAFPRSFGDISRGNAFRGGGQRFRLEATPGSDVSRYLVNWTDPFFLDSVYSLGVSGFYYTRFFEEYDEQRLGGRINVGRNWNPYFSTGFTVRLENVELDDPVVPTPAILAEDLGDNFLFTLGVNARYDTRDSAINPSDGFLGEISYEQGLADSVYPRIEATGTNYYTLYSRPDGSGKQILTTRGQIGWSGEDVPFFERFFAGGFQTFRGFDFRGVGPREFGAAIGGRFLLLGTVEYRLPITANDALSAVVFSDFGTVEEDVEIETFRVTVGAGARIQVAALGPVPLAFDFAVPLNDADFDDRELFSFYVGVQR